MIIPKPRWYPAYVGVGSNLELPEDQVKTAFEELGEIADCLVTGVSGLYRSAPMGPADQPDFINAVVAMVTLQEPHRLLSALQSIESAHGRKHGGELWGPRTLDLDLLVYGNETIEDETLTLPHPGIRERNFVLLPLNELAPHLIVSGLGSVAALTRAVAHSNGRIERI